MKQQCRKLPQTEARSTGSSFNYHNRASFSHIRVQCAKWAIKKTNSISEVLGACACLCSPPHSHIEHSGRQLNDACRQRERQGGPSYSTVTSMEEVNSPTGIKYTSHMSTLISLVSLVRLSHRLSASQIGPSPFM